LTLYFLESSALAKLFVEESGSQRMIALVEPLAQAQKLVSSLGTIEVHSAIRRRERASELSPADAADAVGILTSEIALMTEQPFNPFVVETAKRMLDDYALRALDAIQLGSCWVARAASGITDVVFVASDHALLSAAASEGFQTFDPETDDQ
jgi:predicted nucleic acid-binding protein